MRRKDGIAAVLLLAWSINSWNVGELALAQPSMSTPEQTSPSYKEAVNKALTSLTSKDFFARVKNPDEYARNLGFRSAAEVADAILGMQPLEIKRVGLSQLSKFTRGNNIDEIWDNVHAYLFPVYFKEEQEDNLRSSLTVTEVNKAWQWTRRGSPKLIHQLEKYRARIKRSGGSSDNLFVTIPGLNLHFLGQSAGSQMILVPLSNVTIGEVTLVAGQSLPASLAFEKLAPEAARALAAERPQKGSQQGGSILFR